MGIKRITDPNGGYLGQCVSFVKTYADRLGIKLGVFRGPESDQYYQDGAKYGFLAPLSPAEKYEKITFNGNERPQVGDIIFFNNKTFGHVAVINKVLANGDIEIQESNADNLAPNTSVTRKVISLKKGGANTYDDVLGWLRLKL